MAKETIKLGQVMKENPWIEKMILNEYRSKELGLPAFMELVLRGMERNRAEMSNRGMEAAIPMTDGFIAERNGVLNAGAGGEDGQRNKPNIGKFVVRQLDKLTSALNRYQKDGYGFVRSESIQDILRMGKTDAEDVYQAQVFLEGELKKVVHLFSLN